MLTLVALANAGSFTSTPALTVTGDGDYRYGILVDGTGPLALDATLLPAWSTLSTDERWVSSTIAGGGSPLFPGGPGETGFVDGPAADARFAAMYGVALAPNGDLYVADTHNHALRRLDALTGEVSTVAGDGAPGELWFPQGVAVAPDGRVVVADSFNHCIRIYDPADGSLEVLAGIPGTRGADDGLLGTFDRPKGVAVGPDGVVYVADTDNEQLRAIALDGTVSTLAGSVDAVGFVDGVGSAARFSSPRGIQVHDGGLYVADKDNHAIRRVDLLTLEVHTVAGLGTHGNVDGDVAVAAFFHPFDVAVDAMGDVYVPDSTNHTIRRVRNGVVETLAGLEQAPRLRDGVGDQANFYFPRAVEIDVDGSLLIADRTNGALRRLQPVAATLLGTATPAELGPHSVELQLTDEVDTVVQDFVIDVGAFNGQPVIEGSPAVVVDEGQPYSFTPVASDPDGDPLVFQVHDLPPWATFDPATGTLQGTPGFSDAKVWSHLAITVDDGRGVSNSTATLRPYALLVRDVNRAPALGGPAPDAVSHEPYAAVLTWVDPDGDPVTASASGLPGWLTFDPHTGMLQGTPGGADVGPVVFQLQLDDGRGTTVSVTTADVAFTVIARDLPPEAFAPVPSLALDAEQSGTVAVPADACVDPEGAPVTYRIVGPGWATLAGLTLTATPPQAAHGGHFVELYGDDGALESFCGTIEIQVTDRIGPTVELVGPASVARTTRFSVQVTPSEPLAYLDTADFVIDHGTAESFIVHPAGQVLVVRPTGDGDIVITLPAGSLEDVPGNPNPQSHSITVGFEVPPPSPPWVEESGCGCKSGGHPVFGLVLLLPLLRRRSLHP